MPFVRKNWSNNPPSSSTPITAAELNRIENGVSQAHTVLDSHATSLDQAHTTLDSHATSLREAQASIVEALKTSKGWLSTETDFDELRTPQDIGVWAIRLRDIVNGPDLTEFGVSEITRFLFEVTSTDNTVIVQFLYPRHSAIPGYFYRMNRDSNVFYDWQHVVTHEDLDKVKDRVRILEEITSNYPELLSEITDRVTDFDNVADRVDRTIPIIEEAYQSGLVAVEAAELVTSTRDELQHFLENTKQDGFIYATPNTAGLMSKEDKIQVNKTSLINNITSYDVVGDGETNDYSEIQRAINETPAGGFLCFPSDVVYAVDTETPIMVNHPITIQGGSFNVVNGYWLRVLSSDVKIIGNKVDGGLVEQKPTRLRHSALMIRGTREEVLKNIEVRNNIFYGIEETAIKLEYNQNFIVDQNYIERFGYSGISASSGKNGTITNNVIKKALQPEDTNNSYGISATDGANLREWRSEFITIANNHIEDIPLWKGVDTHGGREISVLNNRVIDCLNGIGLASGGMHRLTAPEDCTVIGNYVAAPNLTGNTRGISIGGFREGQAGKEEGYPEASAIISNNTIADVFTPINIHENAPIDRNRSIITNNRYDGDLVRDELRMKFIEGDTNLLVVEDESVVYNTGWRDTAPIIESDTLTSDSRVLIKRTTHELHISIEISFIQNPVSSLVVNLPVGYRPNVDTWLTAHEGVSGVEHKFRVSRTGFFRWMYSFSHATGERNTETLPDSNTRLRLNTTIPAFETFPTSEL